MARRGFIRMGMGLGQKPGAPSVAANPWPAAGDAVGVATVLSTIKFPATAPYMALTDLAFHPTIGPYGCLFLCCREGATHTSHDGKVRIYGCPDGSNWAPLALLVSPYSDRTDLRDPHLLACADGRLMLHAMATNGTTLYQAVAAFSTDGRTWGAFFPIGTPNRWPWRVTQGPDGKFYTVDYNCLVDSNVNNLLVSTDGITYTTLAADFAKHQGAATNSEGCICFRADGSAVVSIRSDNGATWNATGVSAGTPWDTWTKSISPVSPGSRIASPVLHELPDTRLLLVGRAYYPTLQHVSMGLLDVSDPASPGFTELIALTPNTADAGYPGHARVRGLDWVSYGSDHTLPGTPSIYVSAVQLPPIA